MSDASLLFYSGTDLSWDQFYDRVYLFLNLDPDYKIINEKDLRKAFDPRMTKVTLAINEIKLCVKDRDLRMFLEGFVVDGPKEVERSEEFDI